MPFSILLSFCASCFTWLLFFLFSRSLGSQFLAFLEAFHVTAGIEKFLLTSVARMALAADFSINLFYSGASGELVAARAGNSHIGVVSWMNSSFHKGPFFAILDIWQV